jgi:predicted nucleic acid-binding protein
MPPGLIDTNVFLHAAAGDRHGQECERFLNDVEQGRTSVVLDVLVVHELSHALPRYRQQMKRVDVAA